MLNSEVGTEAPRVGLTSGSRTRERMADSPALTCAGISRLPKTGAVTNREETRTNTCKKAQNESAEKAARSNMGKSAY